MKKDEILTLVKAGFTAEQIMKLDNNEPSGEAAPGLVNPSIDADEPDPAPAQPFRAGASEGSNDEKSTTDEIAEAMKEISKRIDNEIGKLTKAYQEYNILQANNKVETAAGVDEVLGTIINPPFMVDNKKGEK